MGLLQHLLHVTNFKNPFLRTLVPSVGAVVALQAAAGIPSIIAQTDRFYDASGAVTFLAVTVLSLYLPHLRTRAVTGMALPNLLSGAFNWRQVALSAAVVFWCTRLGSYLFQRVLSLGHDSRFDRIKKEPPKFAGAWMGQIFWVTLCLMPVIAINAVPAAAFSALPRAVSITDYLGLALWLGGFGFEIVADRQKGKWLDERKNKEHDEQFMTRGLYSKSQYPNYFGECTLWFGLATTAAGVLVTRPAQLGLGMAGGLTGQALALGLSYVSPAFTTLVLTKVTGIALSERKYDKLYGDRKDYQEYRKNVPKFFPRL